MKNIKSFEAFSKEYKLGTKMEHGDDIDDCSEDFYEDDYEVLDSVDCWKEQGSEPFKICAFENGDIYLTHGEMVIDFPTYKEEVLEEYNDGDLSLKEKIQRIEIPKRLLKKYIKKMSF